MQQFANPTLKLTSLKRLDPISIPVKLEEAGSFFIIIEL